MGTEMGDVAMAVPVGDRRSGSRNRTDATGTLLAVDLTGEGNQQADQGDNKQVLHHLPLFGLVLTTKTGQLAPSGNISGVSLGVGFHE